MTAPATLVDDWTAHARCRTSGLHPELWHPSEHAAPGDIQRAKRVCRTCPVRSDCLEHAMAIEQPSARHGIWGGWRCRTGQCAHTTCPEVTP